MSKHIRGYGNDGCFTRPFWRISIFCMWSITLIVLLSRASLLSCCKTGFYREIDTFVSLLDFWYCNRLRFLGVVGDSSAFKSFRLNVAVAGMKMSCLCVADCKKAPKLLFLFRRIGVCGNCILISGLGLFIFGYCWGLLSSLSTRAAMVLWGKRV
jgi:hypothetical protein